MNKQELLHALNWITNTYPNVGRFESGFRTGLATAIAEIEKLDEPEKVVIPRFVAEWIEECQKRGLGLGQALDYGNLDIMPHEMKEYIKFNFSKLGCGHDKQELVARAWIDGYEVEKEKLYVVELNNDYLTNYLAYDMVYELFFISKTQEDILNKYKKKFTEKEIKDYDERYWPFAVEVAE